MMTRRLNFPNWELRTILDVVRVIAKRTLREFWEKHASAEVPLKTWFDVAEKTDWATPHDVKATYAHASILPNDRAVFNIKGNDFRLVTWINYPKQIIFVKFIGTHAEYDNIDASTY